MSEALLTIDEAAAYLQVSVPTLRRMYKNGGLQHVKFSGTLVRFRKADIDAFVTSKLAGGEQEPEKRTRQKPIDRSKFPFLRR